MQKTQLDTISSVLRDLFVAARGKLISPDKIDEVIKNYARYKSYQELVNKAYELYQRYGIIFQVDILPAIKEFGTDIQIKDLIKAAVSKINYLLRNNYYLLLKRYFEYILKKYDQDAYRTIVDQEGDANKTSDTTPDSFSLEEEFEKFIQEKSDTKKSKLIGLLQDIVSNDRLMNLTIKKLAQEVLDILQSSRNTKSLLSPKKFDFTDWQILKEFIGYPIELRPDNYFGYVHNLDINKYEEIVDYLNHIETLRIYRREDGYLPYDDNLWLDLDKELKADSAAVITFEDGSTYYFIAASNYRLCVGRRTEEFDENRPNVILAYNKLENRPARKFIDSILLDYLDMYAYYKYINPNTEKAEAIQKYFDLIVDWFSYLLDNDDELLHKLEYYVSDEFIGDYYADYRRRFMLFKPEEFLSNFRKPFFILEDYDSLNLYSFKFKFIVPFMLNTTHAPDYHKIKQLWEDKVLIELLKPLGEDKRTTYQRIEAMITDKVQSTQFTRQAMWSYLEKTINKSPQYVSAQLMTIILYYALALNYKTKNITGFLVEYVSTQIRYIMSQIYNANKVYTPPAEPVSWSFNKILQLTINRETVKMLYPILDYYGEQTVQLLQQIEYKFPHPISRIITQQFLSKLFDDRINIDEYVGANLKFINLYLSYILQQELKLVHLATLMRSVEVGERLKYAPVSFKQLRRYIGDFYKQFPKQQADLLKREEFIQKVLQQLHKLQFVDIFRQQKYFVNLQGILKDITAFYKWLKDDTNLQTLIIQNYFVHEPKKAKAELSELAESLIANSKEFFRSH